MCVRDIGDETDHELSLSREDDSDLSVISDRPFEEKKSAQKPTTKKEQEFEVLE